MPSTNRFDSTPPSIPDEAAIREYNLAVHKQLAENPMISGEDLHECWKNATDRARKALLGVRDVPARRAQIAKEMNLSYLLDPNIPPPSIRPPATQLSPRDLARYQRETASVFPGKYVVLVGTELLCATVDRAEALQYSREADRAGRPNVVVIPPGGRDERTGAAVRSPRIEDLRSGPHSTRPKTR